MLIDICIKFGEYCLSGFHVIERTRFANSQIMYQGKALPNRELPMSVESLYDVMVL